MIDQEEIHRTSKSGNPRDRIDAINQIILNFSALSDKIRAWEDLHRLSTDEDRNVRCGAASGLNLIFSEIPDKNRAWKDLHRLSTDEDSSVRGLAALGIGRAFSEILDKNKAWEDLRKLSTDEDIYVRSVVASALGQAFLEIPDKNGAWNVLQRLSTDEDIYVRSMAALSIGQAFSKIPDKNGAWKDLQRLSTDEDIYVRSMAALSIGQAFSEIPDKNEAWKDLQRLSTDGDRSVLVCANHSLGRASIFNATKAENEEILRRKLEEALEFFEISTKAGKYYSPSKFCSLFYQSFYALIFKIQDTEAEVQKYLAVAKSASEGSENKEKLLEAIENLSNALKEAQNTDEMNLDAKKRHLNACRRYCDRAAELLADTREDAPVATKLIEKGIPIIDHRIRETLAEIQEKTSAVCKQTLDTPAEEFGKEIARQGKALCQVRDPIQLEKAVINLERTLSSQVKDPKIQELIERAHFEPNVEDKLNIYNIIFGIILGKSQGSKEGLVKTINIQNMNIPANGDKSSIYKQLKPFLEIGGFVVTVIAVLIAAFEAGIL